MNVICDRVGTMTAELYGALSAFRRKVFIDRLGWNLPGATAGDQDQFDRDDTVHLVGLDASGEVTGCGRLLPTTRSYLLQEVFPHLLNGVAPPCDPRVWELSRFAAARDRRGRGGPGEEHPAEVLLLRALQYCQAHGATQLLAVTSLAVERLMLKAGVDVKRLGPPHLVDGQPVLAFVIQVNERSIVALSVFDNAAMQATEGSRFERPPACGTPARDPV